MHVFTSCGACLKMIREMRAQSMHTLGTTCWSLAGSFAARVSSDGAWQAVETSSPLGMGPRRA